MNPREVNILKHTFHKYKDPLMRLSRDELPQEREVLDDKHITIFTKALQHHPRAAAKIGCGIQGFFARRSVVTIEADDNGESKLKEVCCMYVLRVDDTEEDFSIFSCIGKESWKSDGKDRFDATTGKIVKHPTDQPPPAAPPAVEEVTGGEPTLL